MSPKRFICPFIMLIIIPEGLSQLVKTQPVVTVTLGEDAHFNCSLMQPKDILQVTWQKETPGGTENMATYNKRFGSKVNPPFQKVVFQDMGLQKSSIVIREVSREDECCYKCLFNSNPGGSISGKTCLQVNELYGPTLLVTQTDDSHTSSSVSCSVTGRPAPIVTWDETKYFLEKPTTVSVNHPNGTVTVTLTSTMAVPSVDTVIGCVVLSGEVIKVVSKEIKAISISYTGFLFVGKTVAVGMCSAGGIVFTCGLVYWLFKRRHEQSRKQSRQQDDAEIRVPLPTRTPVKYPENHSGSVRTPCVMVEEGRLGKEKDSTVKKRTINRDNAPLETQCKKELFK